MKKDKNEMASWELLTILTNNVKEILKPSI